MRRFALLLVNEFRLFKTAIPIHVVITVQPTVMYVLMAVILVHPTFDMNVAQPRTEEGWALVTAMKTVGSAANRAPKARIAPYQNTRLSGAVL